MARSPVEGEEGDGASDPHLRGGAIGSVERRGAESGYCFAQPRVGLQA